MGTSWNGLARNKPPRKISLKRLAMLKKNNIKYNSTINRMSKKKQRALAQEVKVHAVIKKRANGHCEVCGFPPCAPTYKLDNHELIFRSALGKVSETNTFGVDSVCHLILQQHLINYKGQCRRIIMMARNCSYDTSLVIYDRIYQFAEKHNLIRDSKLNETI